MSRQLLQRYLPDAHKLREQKTLRMFGNRLHDPNLWHFNRRSVSVAAAVGVGCAFIPLPIQMPIAAGIAILVRCNLPLAACLVWISNPLTIPPIFYFAWWLGTVLIGAQPPVAGVADVDGYAHMAHIWQPLLLGCAVAGLSFGLLTLVVVRWAWRLHVLRRWQQRRRLARAVG